MAYQASDHERWKASWWVIGIRIGISNNHPMADICDDLAGDYPSDFKFTGWHPQCRCFSHALTMTHEQISDYFKRKRAGEDMTGYEAPGKIKEPPEAFKQWAGDNIGRFSDPNRVPYFLRDNAKYTGLKLKPTTHPAAPAKPSEPSIQEQQSPKPPKSETYASFHEGKVLVSPLHGANEVEANKTMAFEMNSVLNEPIYLLPRIDPKQKDAEALRKALLPHGVKDGKNADFMACGRIWEGKEISFENTEMSRKSIKQTIENHIKKAKKQADNIVLALHEDIDDKWIEDIISNALNRSKEDRWIIVISEGKLTKLYKKNKPGEIK